MITDRRSFLGDEDISNEIMMAIPNMDTTTILARIVHYSESVLHWAVCNNIEIDDAYVSAILFAKSVIDSPVAPMFSDKDTVKAWRRLERGIRNAYMRFGGYDGIEGNDMRAIIALIMDDAFGANTNNYRGELRHHDLIALYHRFLMECAYFIGAKNIIRSVSLGSLESETVCDCE